MEVLRSKQANKLLDRFDEDLMPDNKYTSSGPDADAIRKTPGAYTPPVPTSTPLGAQAEGQAAPSQASADGQAAASQVSADGQTAASQNAINGQQDIEMGIVVPVKKPAPVTPEQQVLNAALKDLAKLLTGALPISRRMRLASAHGKPILSNL